MRKSLKKVAHELANDLYEAGVIDAVTLREYDALSVSPVRELKPRGPVLRFVRYGII